MIEIDARHQAYEVSDLDAGTLLGFVAEDRVRQLKADRRRLRLAYQWVVLNPPTPESPAAVAGDLTLIANDCEDPIAGEGTPEVALFAVEDYSAAAGITRISALSLIGDTLDLVHRLPKLWAEVEALEVPAWKARKVALITRALSFEAARWFDDQLAEVGRYGWPTISEWFAYATAKFHPELVDDPNEPLGKKDWGVRLRHHNTGREEGTHGVGGTSELTALGDSLDLERFYALITAEAERMKAEGDTDTLAQRRAKAIGRLVDDTLGPDGSVQAGLDLADDTATGGARGEAHSEAAGDEHGEAARESSDTEADTGSGTAGDAAGAASGAAAAADAETGAAAGASRAPGTPGAADTSAPRPKMTGHPDAFTKPRGLQVMVHVSLTDLLNLTATDTKAGDSNTGEELPGIASTDRVGQILVAQLRDWLQRHGSQARVTPVLDMNRADQVDRHAPPAWMAQQVRLRDPHCVYPDCNRSAWACDLDHIDPYGPPDEGGPPGQTRPENLAPLCRRHHLVKTSGRWRYQRTPDGTYVWTNRYGHTYLVTPQGTINITEAA